MVEISSAEVPDDWADRWRDFHEAVTIGERLVVRPSWQAPAAAAAEVDVVIDPGQAFGTGAHATTRLCLELLLELADDGRTSGSLADLGTGSGVLAIAAAKLGATKVDTVDVESVAVAATRENAERNGVADRIAVELGSVGPGQPFQGQHYDVVLANIIARILIELSEAIVAHT